MTNLNSIKYYNSPQYSQSAPKMTSRRAKVEQSKLLKQSVLFGVLAVVLLIVGGFVIIPAFIRFVGGFSKPVQTTSDDGVPIQIPIVQTPLAATSSATLALTGFHQKGYEIVVVNNGRETARVKTQDDGSFATDVTLESGENRLTAYAVNEQKKESGVSAEYLVLFDNEPPKLEITEPTDGQSIEGKKNQNLTIKGTTDPKVKMQLNDRLFFIRTDGTFETTFRLNNGENTLTIKATDEAGNTTEKVVKVNFRE
jgi:hypothetical protein